MLRLSSRNSELRNSHHQDSANDPLGAEKAISFNLADCSPVNLSEQSLGRLLYRIDFEDVLRYVALPRISFLKDDDHSPTTRVSRETVDEPGRGDVRLVFDYLRHKKKVKRILRVIVDDLESPSHSDEAIEFALAGMNVEAWDWRRYDLCIETVFQVAPEVTELSLYWSGNKTVLCGWSETLCGLPRLTKLRKLHVWYAQVRLKCLRRPSASY